MEKYLRIILSSVFLATTLSMAAQPNGIHPPFTKTGRGDKSASTAVSTPSSFRAIVAGDRNSVIEPEPAEHFIMPVGRPADARKSDGARKKELIVNMIHHDGWDSRTSKRGFYSINPNTGEMTLLCEPEENNAGTGTVAYFNGGSAIQNGQLYGFHANFDVYFSYGVIMGYFYQINTDGWNPVNRGRYGYNYYTTNSLIAVETATDQLADKVYGEFYGGNGLELGTIDYSGSEPKRTSAIGSLNQHYVALGSASDGYLYGVATDGNLYKIDPDNAAETLVGATGVGRLTLQESDTGEYYAQGGEIDQGDDTFYWASMDSTGHSAMYTVDIHTGTATKLCDIPNNAELISVIVPAPAAADGAPDTASDLQLKFENGSTTGEVSFNAPSLTYDQSSLSGPLSYTVYGNDEILKTGTTAAGQQTTVTVTAPEGDVEFAVTTSNGAGESPKIRKSAWVGYDIPEPATDVNFTLGSTRQATVTWTAPVKGTHNAYLGALTYNVLRISGSDTTLVADHLADTKFSETLAEGQLKYYYYAVRVNNGNRMSAYANSNGHMMGYEDTPYIENFDDEQDFNYYTVIDANEDDNTWEAGDGEVSYLTFRFSSCDDWLITPSINLKGGKRYVFSYSARTDGNSADFESYMGTSPEVSSLTTLLSQHSIKDKTYQNYSDTVSISADGHYNFGIHLSGNLVREAHINSVSVVMCPDSTTPDSVRAFTVTPDAEGALMAQISFTAPSVSVNGDRLQRLSKIELQRDGNVVHTFTDIAPGAVVTYDDSDNLTRGYHQWLVVAYSSSTEDGRGRESAVVRAYIGWDTPKALSEVSLTDNITSVTLNWSKVSNVGVNGGTVNTNAVTYNVFSGETDPYIGFMPADTILKTKATTCEIPFNTNEGEQGWVYFGVQPDNGQGYPEVTTARVLAGAPYPVPFNESFVRDDMGYLSHYWTQGSSDVSVKYSKDGVDGDGAALEMTSMKEGLTGDLYSGKLTVSGLTNPTLYFALKSSLVTNPFSVYAMKTDGTTMLLGSVEYPSSTYRYEKIDLSDLDGQSSFRLIFSGEFSGAGSFTIDDINVANLYRSNLAVTSLTAPGSVTTGTEQKVAVKVRNLGWEDIPSYKVELKANDKVIDTLVVNKPLASLADNTLTFTYAPSVFEEAGTVRLTASVVCNGDEVSDDNTMTSEIELTQPSLASPKNLNAQNEQYDVALTWDAPAVASSKVVENFDEVEPWSADNVEGWTFVNSNSAPAAPIFANIKLPHEQEAYAFVAANFTRYWDDGYLDGHSGHQYLFSPQRYDKSFASYADADNWAISPVLSGHKQTIKFWVLNQPGDYSSTPETFDVLYSSTGTSTSDFIKVGETRQAVGGEWKEVEFEVPEGAKYFAIHQNTPSSQSLLFGIDDVTYDSFGEVDYYRIYVDGKLAATSKETNSKLSSDAVSNGSHEIAVTCVYTNGLESLPVSITYVVDITSGINSILANGMPLDIYTVDGKLVRSGATTFKGLKRGLYVINGKKVVIK